MEFLQAVVLALIGGVVAIVTVRIQVSAKRENREDHGVTTDAILEVKEQIVEAREVLLDSRATVLTLAETVAAQGKVLAKQTAKLDDLTGRLVGNDHKLDHLTLKVELLDRRVGMLERTPEMIVYPGASQLTFPEATTVTVNEDHSNRPAEPVEDVTLTTNKEEDTSE